MPQSPSLVLDTNAFIESKNRFYAFDICPGFWDFVIEDFDKGNAMSITHVRDEILTGGDDLSVWVRDKLDKVHFFDCGNDLKVIAAQQRVASHVMNTYSKPNVVSDFLKPGVADSWIVAYTLAHGGIVVTQETHKRRGKKVSLTDVCDHFGVHHVDIFEFLRIEKARFVYERSHTA